ncbi:MAG: hypothetical protein H0X03_08735 [Nitrosopumilus sp.]|nr:hypothetical protein [Nitrosopumilus sp.]
MSFYSYKIKEQSTFFGEIQNLGDEEFIEVEVILTLYDKDKKIVGLKSVLTQPNYLGPYAKSTFKIDVTAIDDPNFAWNYYLFEAITTKPAYH